MDISFTETELAYLRGQRLGRLATVDKAGAPQNNPVGYLIDDETGQLVIAGYAMGKSRKYRNVQNNPEVSLVIDDIASVDPWRVRGVEVRGTAEAQDDVDPPVEGTSREVIRITPRWIGSWGLAPGEQGLRSRGVQATVASGDEPSVRDAVRALVDTYFHGFDERRNDAPWLASIFTPDVTVRFPPGRGEGLSALRDLSERVLSLWAATLHQTSNHQVNRTPDGAEFTAALTATHVHRPETPGAHLRIGARVSGTAVRLPRGWRIDGLTVELVWSEGDGPAGREAGTPPGHDAG
jgi:pyridoxamine 5'-phosphate oxidase family protein